MTRVKVKSSYESLGGYSDFVDRNRGLNELGELFREKTKDPSNSRGVVSKVVSIWSDGTRMTGTLWKPKGALGAPESSYPAILLCHGWGGIRDHLDVRFGQAFAQAGFVTLTFDYRGWNDSDGVMISAIDSDNTKQQDTGRESDASDGAGSSADNLKAHIVRKTVDMDWQLTDIESAFYYLDGEKVVDSERIGIWGISQGGGHVLSFGGRMRDRVRAIVAEVPSCGVVGAGKIRELKQQAREEAISRARGDISLSVKQGAKNHHLTGMDGCPQLSKLVRYRPLDSAQFITSPTLIIDARDEEIFDREENGKAAWKILKENGVECAYEVLPGRHYDAYDGKDGQFKQGTSMAVDFFKKHLGEGKRSKL